MGTKQDSRANSEAEACTRLPNLASPVPTGLGTDRSICQAARRIWQKRRSRRGWSGRSGQWRL